jgi:hypothetical protein
VPKADSTLGCGGTITSELCRSAATSQAWTGPAPPKAKSGMPRESTPRSVAWARTAAAMENAARGLGLGKPEIVAELADRPPARRLLSRLTARTG